MGLKNKMILGLKNIRVIFALVLLAGVNGFHNSAIADVNSQPLMMAQVRGITTNSQVHQVFRSILPKLKQKTQIQILLPKFVPGSDGENPLYAIIETATKNKYEILLGFSPDCNGGTACRLGVVTAEAVTKKTPRLSGKPVSLAKGITGYFEDFKCGANCSDATLSWRHKGVQYAIGLKAGDRTSLVKMANSAISP